MLSRLQFDRALALGRAVDGVVFNHKLVADEETRSIVRISVESVGTVARNSQHGAEAQAEELFVAATSNAERGHYAGGSRFLFLELSGFAEIAFVILECDALRFRPHAI